MGWGWKCEAPEALHLNEKVAKILPGAQRYPNLFLAGAPRAGTTFLYDLLCQSGEIFAGKDKEPAYFYFKDMAWVIHDGQRLRNRKEAFLERAYLDLFVDWKDEPWAIDGSTYYLLDPRCAERIYAHSPAAKIILILREPVARAYSHYLMERRDGWLAEDFSQALRKEIAEVAVPEKPYAGHYHLMRGSQYCAGLKAFVDHFGSANVFVLKFEDLVSDSQRCLDLICDFIGIARFVPVEAGARKNESGVHINAAAARLASRYRYSSVRNIVSGIVPKVARDKVRAFLTASRHADAPPPRMRDEDKANLQGRLGEEYEAALKYCRENHILRELTE